MVEGSAQAGGRPVHAAAGRAQQAPQQGQRLLLHQLGPAGVQLRHQLWGGGGDGGKGGGEETEEEKEEETKEETKEWETGVDRGREGGDGGGGAEWIRCLLIGHTMVYVCLVLIIAKNKTNIISINKPATFPIRSTFAWPLRARALKQNCSRRRLLSGEGQGKNT